MEQINLMQKVHKVLDSQKYQITFSPSNNDDWFIYVNDMYIGGIFAGKICLKYTNIGNELANGKMIVYDERKLVVCTLNNLKSVFEVTYTELCSDQEFVCDISYHFKVERGHPDVIKYTYNLFCFF